VTLYDWLLFFHVFSAFVVAAGLVVAGAGLIGALRAGRPSRVAILLAPARLAARLFDVGGLAILVFGIWLTIEVDGYELWDAWILSAIVLWLVIAYTGSRAVTAIRAARDLASGRASAGDTQTPELAAALRNRRATTLWSVANVAFFVTLVLMIWKPGA
jgi:uncharacterized membrane protein